MVHLIHYELKGHRSRFEYERLAEAIKNISGVYCHTPESTWLVETELTTRQVVDRIAPLTVVGDPLLVFRLHNDWSSYSFTQEQINWLRGRNFTSLAEAVMSVLPLGRGLASTLTSPNSLGGR